MDPLIDYKDPLIDFIGSSYRFDGSPQVFPIKDFRGTLIDYMDPLIAFPHGFHGSPYRFA